MPKVQRLQERGGWFYLRAKVPADLVEHYGKWDIKRGLKTRNRREATTLLRIASASLEVEFERLRKSKQGMQSPDQPNERPKPITDDARQLALKYFAGLEEMLNNTPPPGKVD